MDVYRTEEEQLEVIKRWYREYGTSIMVGILVVLLAIVGWQYFKGQQLASKSEASSQYQSLVDALNAAPAEGKEDAFKATVQHLAEELKKDHPESIYAHYAGLLLASVAAEGGDLARAETELRAVIAAQPETSVLQVANFRLAKILFSLNRQEEALQLLDAGAGSEFAAAYAELRGDILLQQGNKDAARTAYQAAATARAAKGLDTGRFLQMKIDSLAVAQPDIVIAAPADVTEAGDKSPAEAGEGDS